MSRRPKPGAAYAFDALLILVTAAISTLLYLRTGNAIWFGWVALTILVIGLP